MGDVSSVLGCVDRLSEVSHIKEGIECRLVVWLGDLLPLRFHFLHDFHLIVLVVSRVKSVPYCDNRGQTDFVRLSSCLEVLRLLPQLIEFLNHQL